MIQGFSIGHHTADSDGWLTGTTVILAQHGAVGGADVRGGGPGTRETDLLQPSAMVQAVHAVVLTGGSAYGLAAADGVLRSLGERGIGFPVPTPQADRPAAVVPIVPAAVIFDLGRGGVVDHVPDAGFGVRALAAAFEADQGPRSTPSVGPAVDLRTGRPWADPLGSLRTPDQSQRAAIADALAAMPSLPLNTTIAAVLTDAPLDKSQATKVAQVSHDGLARAVRPAHRMIDGDTIFCLASGRGERSPDPGGLFDLLLTAAAEVVEQACLVALLSATGTGPWPAYADLVPDGR